MSAHDVELAQVTFDSLVREGYEAVLERIHPDFRMETPAGMAAEPQLYEGRDGMRRWWESFFEVMDDVSVVPIGYHDAGPGIVAVEAELRATGQASGLEVTQGAVLLLRTRDDLLWSIQAYETLDEALGAAAP